MATGTDVVGAGQDARLWRIAATGLSFTIFGIGGLLLGYVVFPLVALLSADRERCTRRCRRLIHYAFRGFVSIMRGLGVIETSISREASLAGNGKLIVANHPSLIDIVLIIALIPNACCIVKSSLFRNPFTRGPISWAGYVANDAPDSLLAACESVLHSGASLVVFPEGTRSESGKPLHFRRGAAYVWLRTRCELVLATIKVTPPTLGKDELWYEVAPRRPVFALQFRGVDETGLVERLNCPDITARKVNRCWQEYFLQELNQ